MIDIHTHLHPPRLFAAIRRWFAERSDWDLACAPTEPQAVAAVLRAASVERFVFCSYAHKPGMARELNAWLVRTSEELGRYGLPLATVHPDDPEYVDDLRIALEGGCIGLKLHEDVQRLAADDPRLDPIYEKLAARGAFLLVHAGAIPWRYVAGDGLGRIGRVLERHPRLTVVVAHFGVPDTERYYELMERHASLYLDTTMIFAPNSPMLAPDVSSLARTRPERVLYGTDYPNVPHPYPSERVGLEALGLSNAALQAILHDNAERIIARALAD
jgi:predicted TIM-barrel fold metal-dependent hydrolase